MEPRDVAGATMGPVTAATLRVLAGTERGLTARQLARLSGASHTGTVHVLARLQQSGLVKVAAAGGASLCSLNREHIATPLIIELVNLHRGIVDAVRTEVVSWRPRPLNVSLYGSFARNEETLDSDIDVLVVLPDGATEQDWSQRFHDSALRLQRRTGHSVSWFPLTRTELRRGRKVKEPIMQEWLHESVLLMGHPLIKVVAST